MLVSCSYCNAIHERGKKCHNRQENRHRKKEETYISRFRSTTLWKKKRLEIKNRDKFLCQVCLIGNKYVFNNLEVHHIVPISKAWEKRLENGNLITLCIHCHKQAEMGSVSRSHLFNLVKDKE